MQVLFIGIEDIFESKKKNNEKELSKIVSFVWNQFNFLLKYVVILFLCYLVRNDIVR